MKNIFKAGEFADFKSIEFERQASNNLVLQTSANIRRHSKQYLVDVVVAISQHSRIFPMPQKKCISVGICILFSFSFMYLTLVMQLNLLTHTINMNSG